MDVHRRIQQAICGPDTGEDSKGFLTDFYCRQMRDAVHSVMIAMAYEQRTTGGRRPRSDVDGLHGGFIRQYAVCVHDGLPRSGVRGPNAPIESSPNVSQALYLDFEKLQTISKYELFALLRGTHWTE